MGFKKRNHISNRKPEATSTTQSTAFNKHTILDFFTNLTTVYTGKFLTNWKVTFKFSSFCLGEK